MDEFSFDEFLNLIDLPKEVISLVDEYKNDYSSNYNEEFLKIKENSELFKKENNDSKGMKILTIYLLKSYDCWNIYKKIGIEKKIYLDTFKCFSRYLKETYIATNSLCFDRYFWAYRQIELNLFKINDLEYEIIKEDKEISLHIPTNINFEIKNIKKNIKESIVFFKKYFPFTNNFKYTCSSWLLSPILKEILHGKSNILKFQELFDIEKIYEDSYSFFFIFQTYSKDIKSFKEETSLQRNLKKYMGNHSVFYSAKGILNIKEI